MKNLLCKIFGHKWIYQVSSINNFDIRSCKHCNLVQTPILIVDYWAWSDLIKRTKKGAKEFFKDRNLFE